MALASTFWNEQNGDVALAFLIFPCAYSLMVNVQRFFLGRLEALSMVTFSQPALLQTDIGICLSIAMQSSIAFKSSLARIALRLPRPLLYGVFKWLKEQLQDLVDPGSYKDFISLDFRHWEPFSKRQQVHESSLAFRQRRLRWLVAGTMQHPSRSSRLLVQSAGALRTLQLLAMALPG